MIDGHDGGADHSGHAGGAFDADLTGASAPSMDLGFLAGSLGGHDQAFEHTGSGHGQASSLSQSGSTGPGGWSFGYVGEALACMGIVDKCAGSVCNAKKGVRLPGVLVREDAGIVQLLVWPHGAVDTQNLFKRVAARYGLISLSRRAPNMVASNKLHKSLLDTKVFDGPGKSSQPSAASPGLTGSTTVWTEFWQKPVKKNFWSSPDIRLGPPMPSHITVTGYTWSYNGIGDYETRIGIQVSNPKTSLGGVWTLFDREAAFEHMELAKLLALELFAELVKVKPARYSIIMRQMHREGLDSLVGVPENSNTVADKNPGPGPGRLAALKAAGVEPMKFEMTGR